MEHSKTFGLSNAGRWVHCSGHVQFMQDEPPEEETQDTKEGTAAHGVGQVMLESFKASEDHIAAGELMVGSTYENGAIITDEMFDAALTYVNQIIAVVPVAEAYRLLVEQRVVASKIDAGCWGTMDTGWYDIQANTLHIWEFKYGHGRVNVFENYQLLAQGQAACETFSYTRINPRLSLNVVQPRCYDGKGTFDTWVIAYDDIRPYVNQMAMSAMEYRKGESMIRVGHWCKNCKTSHKCPAILGAAAHASDFAQTTIALEMTPEAVAYEKLTIDHALLVLTERQSAVNAQAEARIRKGELIPGFRMTDTMSHKKWKDQNPAVLTAMGKMLGINTMNDPKPLTPTQVVTQLKKKKIDENVIAPYYEVTKTGVKLIADDGSKAQRIFSQEKI